MSSDEVLTYAEARDVLVALGYLEEEDEDGTPDGVADRPSTTAL